MFYLKDKPPLKAQLSFLFFHHAVVCLLLTHSCAGQSQVIGPPQPIVATVGDDIILPSHLEPAVDATRMTVEWTRPDLDPRFVHVWRHGQELVSKKHPSYRGRTSLFTDKLKDGDVSLKLSGVNPAYEGKYRCFIPSVGIETTVELIVGAASSPVLNMSKDSSEVVLDCESKGWYPEPELFWLDAEGKLLSAGAPETVRGLDGLYTVSSRVTVEKSHGNSFTCRIQQQKIQQSKEAHIHVPDDFFMVTSDSAVRISIILAVVFLCVVAAIFLVWKLRQNESKTKTHDEEEGGESVPLMVGKETPEDPVNKEQRGGDDSDNTTFVIQADGQKHQEQRGEATNTGRQGLMEGERDTKQSVTEREGETDQVDKKEKLEEEQQKTENEEKHVGEAAAGPAENKELENQTEQLNVQSNETEGHNKNERKPESVDQEVTGSEGDKTDLKLQDKEVEKERDGNKELPSEAERQRTAPKTEEDKVQVVGGTEGTDQSERTDVNKAGQDNAQSLSDNTEDHFSQHMEEGHVVRQQGELDSKKGELEESHETETTQQNEASEGTRKDTGATNKMAENNVNVEEPVKQGDEREDQLQSVNQEKTETDKLKTSVKMNEEAKKTENPPLQQETGLQAEQQQKENPPESQENITELDEKSNMDLNKREGKHQKKEGKDQGRDDTNETEEKVLDEKEGQEKGKSVSANTKSMIQADGQKDQKQRGEENNTEPQGLIEGEIDTEQPVTEREEETDQDIKKEKPEEEQQKTQNEEKYVGEAAAGPKENKELKNQTEQLSSSETTEKETQETNLIIENEGARENEKLDLETEPQTDQEQKGKCLESQEENTEQQEYLNKRHAEHQGKLQEKDQDKGEGQDNADANNEKAQNDINVDDTEKQGDEREEELQSATQEKTENDEVETHEKIKTHEKADERETPLLQQETGPQAEHYEKEDPPKSQEEVEKSNMALKEKEGEGLRRDDADEIEGNVLDEGKGQEIDKSVSDNTKCMIQADGQKHQEQRGEENNTEPQGLMEGEGDTKQPVTEREEETDQDDKKEKPEEEQQKTEHEEKHVGEAAAGPSENKEPENQTERLNMQEKETERQTIEKEKKPESVDREETGSEGDETYLKLQDKDVETERDGNKELPSEAERQRTASKTEETPTSEEGASAGNTATNMEAEKLKQKNNTDVEETKKQSDEEKRVQTEEKESTDLKIQNEAGENKELSVETEFQTDQQKTEKSMESQKEITGQPEKSNMDVKKRDSEHLEDKQDKVHVVEQTAGTDQTERTDVNKAGQDNAQSLSDNTEDDFHTDVERVQDEHLEEGCVTGQPGEVDNKKGELEESHETETPQQDEEREGTRKETGATNKKAENNVNVEETDKQGDEREEKLQSVNQEKTETDTVKSDVKIHEEAAERENPQLHQETGLQTEQQQRENPPESQENITELDEKSNMDLNKKEEKHQEKEEKDQGRDDAHETDNTEFMIQADGQKHQEQRGEENNTEPQGLMEGERDTEQPVTEREEETDQDDKKEKPEGEPQKTEHEEKHVGEAAAGPTENKEPENQTQQLNVQENETEGQTSEKERKPESVDQEETGSEGDETDLKLQDKDVETERAKEGGSAENMDKKTEAGKEKEKIGVNLEETGQQKDKERRLQPGSGEIPEETETTNLKIQNEGAGKNEELSVETEPQTDQKQEENPQEGQEENTEQPKELDNRGAEHQKKDQDKRDGQDNAKPTDETKASFPSEARGDGEQRCPLSNVNDARATQKQPAGQPSGLQQPEGPQPSSQQSDAELPAPAEEEEEHNNRPAAEESSASPAAPRPEAPPPDNLPSPGGENVGDAAAAAAAGDDGSCEDAAVEKDVGEDTDDGSFKSTSSDISPPNAGREEGQQNAKSRTDGTEVESRTEAGGNGEQPSDGKTVTGQQIGQDKKKTGLESTQQREESEGTSVIETKMDDSKEKAGNNVDLEKTEKPRDEKLQSVGGEETQSETEKTDLKTQEETAGRGNQELQQATGLQVKRDENATSKRSGKKRRKRNTKSKAKKPKSDL